MFFVYVLTNCSSSQPIVQALVLLLLILAFQGHPTRLPFLELCFQILLPRYCDYCFKKSFEIFRIKTKGPLESSNERTATPCPRTFYRTHIRVANSFGCDENFRNNQSWNRMPSKIDIKCLMTCTPQSLMSRLMDRKAYYSNSSEKGRQYI